ncbi:MAG: hypothetical protein AB2693_27190, partial [Candidatus Thiodiazotropha sp.]
MLGITFLAGHLILLIWVKVGQRPTVLAVGAGVWTFFLRQFSLSLSLSLSLIDDWIEPLENTVSNCNNTQ